MYTLRFSFASIVFALSIALNSTATADNCPPYSYYPPVLEDSYGTIVGGYFDVNEDGVPDIVDRNGEYALMSDGHAGLDRVRLTNSSLHVSASFLGYFQSSNGLEVVSLAWSHGDMYLLFFKSNTEGERVLYDIRSLGTDDDFIGGDASLPSSPSTSQMFGQVAYVLLHDGVSELHFQLADQGGFRTPEYILDLPFEAHAPRLADLNGDGGTDLLVRDGENNIVTMLRTNTPYPTTFDTSFNLGSDYSDLYFHDLDHDGVVELVFVTDSSIRIYRRANDQYAEWRTYNHETAMKVIGQGDVDNDGDLDFLIREDNCTGADPQTSCLRIVYQSGDFEFSAGPSQLAGAEARSAAVIDINRDGLNDIVRFSYPSSFLYFADGLGGFRQASRIPSDLDEIQAPGTLTAIDVNHDGFDDIMVSQYDPGSFTIAGDGAGTFAPPVMQTTYGPEIVRLADMDDDGFVDVVCVTESSGAMGPVVGYGNADGSLGPFESHSVGPTSGLSGIDVGDIDGDGHLDIACTALGDDQLKILLGNADRTFQPAISIPTPDGPMGVRIADYDNDGLGDVITGNYSDRTFSVYHSTVADGVVLHTTQSASFGAWILAGIETADLDHDGFVDLITPARYGSVEIRWGDGSGRFSQTTELATPWDPEALELVDINLDGWVDIVSHSTTDAVVFDFLNLGNRSFDSAAALASPARIDGLCIGNFDDLGDLDIAVNDGNGVYLYLADTCELESAVPGDTNADGLLTPDDVPDFVAILLDLGGSPGARKAADMNEDGVNDALDITLFVSCLLNGGCE
ncbi:MAG TPA: VCBS repeat-containing protein [Phycisphaerae bacterium]|nr:VCBS repeat-containing protein [Phycisphaerae bacterium]